MSGVPECTDHASQSSADSDPMLQAYGRYWLPQVKRIAEALEKIEAHLAEQAHAGLMLKPTDHEKSVLYQALEADLHFGDHRQAS
ncbi:MAG: hypothetical protein ABJA60_06495, partial [Nitrosospira sp.]